jgi:hypothetical protein
MVNIEQRKSSTMPDPPCWLRRWHAFRPNRRDAFSIAVSGTFLNPRRRFGFVGSFGARDRFPRPFDACFRFDTGHRLERTRNPTHHRAEVRNIDERKNQTDDPKDVHMRKQRDQSQDRNDLELNLLRFVGYALRQSMQPKK